MDNIVLLISEVSVPSVIAETIVLFMEEDSFVEGTRTANLTDTSNSKDLRRRRCSPPPPASEAPGQDGSRRIATRSLLTPETVATLSMKCFLIAVHSQSGGPADFESVATTRRTGSRTVDATAAEAELAARTFAAEDDKPL
jgi:hypothetical protein